MRWRMPSIAFCGAVLCLSSSAQQRYWQDRSAGWFWYEMPPVLVPEQEAEEQPEGGQPTVVAPMPPEDAMPPEVAAHKRLQLDLEQSRSIAIMRPTFANMQAYLAVQQEVMERSSVFADVFQRVVWATPELDYQLQHRPVGAVALRTWDARQQQMQDEAVAKVAMEHGLFFVFGPECIHCPQMASTLSRLSARHAMVVQAVAVDGAAHPSFPGAWPDNGFAASAGIGALPALALANVDSENPQVLIVGYGPLTETQIERRIAVLTGAEVGERF